MTADAVISPEGYKIDWTRLIALFTGFGLFFVIYYSPALARCGGSGGQAFCLVRHRAKGP